MGDVEARKWLTMVSGCEGRGTLPASPGRVADVKAGYGLIDARDRRQLPDRRVQPAQGHHHREPGLLHRPARLVGPHHPVGVQHRDVGRNGKPAANEPPQRTDEMRIR